MNALVPLGALVGKAHAPQQVNDPRVRAQDVIEWLGFEVLEDRRPLFVCFFESFECPIFIAQA